MVKATKTSKSRRTQEAEVLKNGVKKVSVTVPTNEKLLEMMKAGVHFGHKTSRWHPNMAPFIFGVRNTIHIIDLEQTFAKLSEVKTFLKQIAANNDQIILIGTRPHSRQLVRKVADELQIPYVNERWIGGTFTNFKVVRQRIDYYLDFVQKQQKGELDKYTKKERTRFEREIEKLRKRWDGLQRLEQLPKVMILLDPSHNKTAMREAKRKGISIVAVCDTNVDPKQIDYCIPANDDSITSLSWIVQQLREAIVEGRKTSKKAVTEQTD